MPKGLRKDGSPSGILFQKGSISWRRGKTFPYKPRPGMKNHPCWNKQEPVMIICLCCKKSWLESYGHRKRKFCSKQCADNFRKGKPLKEQVIQKMIGRIPWNKGIKYSKELCEKFSKIHKGKHLSPATEFKKGIIPWNKGLKGFRAGEKHSNWKGGISKESQIRIGKSMWHILRTKIYIRDNWTCQICGIKCNKKGMIQCHHIIPYRISKDDSFKNLITLCSKCHMQEDGKWNKLEGKIPYYKYWEGKIYAKSGDGRKVFKSGCG